MIDECFKDVRAVMRCSAKMEYEKRQMAEKKRIKKQFDEEG